MSKKRWTAEDKAKIVMESLTNHSTTADICKKHGLSPNTIYMWREKFLEGGRAALAGAQNTRAARTLQKENTTLKTLVGEITLANDALKKTLEVRKSTYSTPLTARHGPYVAGCRFDSGCFRGHFNYVH